MLREQWLLDQRPERAEAEDFRSLRADPSAGLFGIHRLRLEQLDSQPARFVCDGRWRDLAAAATRAIGPCYHQRWTVRRLSEPPEYRGGELGGPEVDGPHPDC
jgi:hypothetical protein